MYAFELLVPTHLPPDAAFCMATANFVDVRWSVVFTFQLQDGGVEVPWRLPVRMMPCDAPKVAPHSRRTMPLAMLDKGPLAGGRLAAPGYLPLASEELSVDANAFD